MFFSEVPVKARVGATLVSYVLPSRSPALASKNKCLINALPDHLERSSLQGCSRTKQFHTGCRSFVAAQALTIASSCLSGTPREYFLKPSHFGNSLTVD